MDEFAANLGGRPGGRPPPPPCPPFMAPASSSKASTQAYAVVDSGGATAQAVAPPLHGAGHGLVLDPLKAKIVSHPRYHQLLAAFLDCHKVGCPPGAAEEIAAAARAREARQRTAAARAGSDVPAGPDPELDQFMDAYCQMLVECKEELSRPLQEAEEFLRTVESQLNSISTGFTGPAISAEVEIGAGSSDDDQEGSGMETEEAPLIDPRADDKDLKRHLLRKYSGYLGSLRKELSKKKKKGKLPKEARQKLLGWWELHYRWPYPSEMEKIALAESTGLEQKQINNWFINQRKRHWKPSEEMQFAVMEAYHPQDAAAALYLDARLVGAMPGYATGCPDRDFGMIRPI